MVREKQEKPEEAKRKLAVARAGELKEAITDYITAKPGIPKVHGLEDKIEERKTKIKALLGAQEAHWNDWKWQMANQINSVEMLSSIISLAEREKEELEQVAHKHRWAISPYYATLLSPDDSACPIRKIVVPSGAELDDSLGLLDPMGEEHTNPAGSITRRYPDRVALNVTNKCPAFCRFCQRRRNIGSKDLHKPRKVLEESIQYVRDNEEIRDVLITGGDPLTLSDRQLDWLLAEIKGIKHVEIVRIGTRVLANLPQRITKELCEILRKYHPLYINTHFNHPLEMTHEAKTAAAKLADSGIPLGNQMVLLKGINNNKQLVRLLNQELLQNRIRPYYIFHPKPVKGTLHFNCSIAEGVEIIRYLRGYTSGLAVPEYILNAPGGLGKIPIGPEYIVDRNPESLILQTWEGKQIKISPEGTWA